MKCFLKPANVMIVMFLAVIVCGIPPDSPVAKSEFSKASSESPKQSISSTLNSQTSSKSNDASGSVHHTDTSSNKTSTSVSVGCKVEPCISNGSDTDKAKVPSHEMSSQAEVQATDNSKEFSRKINPEALKRGFFVFAGLSVIVLMYIAWKSFGKRPTQVHRYGVITNSEDLEMAPLDSDEGEGDEDDTTHFDISKHRPK